MKITAILLRLFCGDDESQKRITIKRLQNRIKKLEAKQVQLRKQNPIGDIVLQLRDVFIAFRNNVENNNDKALYEYNEAIDKIQKKWEKIIKNTNDTNLPIWEEIIELALREADNEIQRIKKTSILSNQKTK